MSDSKLRWVFIHPFQLRLQRGIEVYLWNIALALALSGVDVTMLTWDGALDVPQYVRHPSVHVLRVPAVRYFQAIFAFPFYVFHLLIGKYSHIFVNFAGYGEGKALSLARLFRPLKFSVVFHFPRSQVPHRYREFERWNFQHDATHLIAVSKATAHEVEQWAGRACTVIGHGVDTERFHPDPVLRAQIRKMLGLESNAPVLISVAALEERKGIQWVIQAMPKLLEKNPNIHYLVIGDGEYKNILALMAKDLAIESKVHFMGIQIDVYPYLCAADIMMVLSQGEASSISLLEALACELPAITSVRPPFDELISETWGIKVDEANAQEVVSAVLCLVEDHQKRNTMGRAGRARIIKCHNWRQIAEQYMELVQKS